MRLFDFFPPISKRQQTANTGRLETVAALVRALGMSRQSGLDADAVLGLSSVALLVRRVFIACFVPSVNV
jgi:uncharacterized MAPEG superfamily protein